MTPELPAVGACLLYTSVPYDSLSGFLDAVEFLPRSFGTWDKTDTGKTGEYTISDYELICILEGFSDLSKNGKIHRAQKGDLLLLEPFAVYSACLLYTSQCSPSGSGNPAAL